MTRIIIHPGMGRTGTTTLQNQIFNNHPGILNLGQPNHESSEYLRFRNGLLFEEDDEYAEACRDICAKASGAGVKIPVLSDENISSAEVQSLAASRLYALFPEATIFFTIRNQADMLVSHWMQEGYINKGPLKKGAPRFVPFEDYIAWNREAMNRRYAASLFHSLNYSIIIKAYRRYFGERVFVLAFEDMVHDSARFFAQLESIVGLKDGSIAARGQAIVKQNAATDNRQLAVTKIVSAPGGLWRYRLLRAAGLYKAYAGGIPQECQEQAKRFIEQPQVRQWLSEFFAAGNGWVATNFDLDLKGKGYS